MLKHGFYRFRWWLRSVRRPPCVVISYIGQLTPRPQIHVWVSGMNGCQGVYTYDADSAGEAKATLDGQSLAHILQRRLVDQRKLPPYNPPENMVDTAAAELWNSQRYNKWEE